MKRRRYLAGLFGLSCLLTVGLSGPVPVLAQPLSPTPPRSRQILDLTRASEPWIRDWEITHTAITFPGGAKAGFYQRAVRTGDAVPHAHRTGILYLYPESDYKPARISRQGVSITGSACRLAMGVSANRSPRGMWLLKVLVNGTAVGGEVMISGRDAWQDIAVDLTEFIGRRVDIDIEAHATVRRAAHVYIDYIRLEDPARQPVSYLTPPRSDGNTVFLPEDEALPYFDAFYQNFLELLLDREERRHDYRFRRAAGYFPGEP